MTAICAIGNCGTPVDVPGVDVDAEVEAGRLFLCPDCTAHVAPPGGTLLLVTDDPKMLRESLCFAQSAVILGMTGPRAAHATRLQRLIAECDRHRPLGPDGKHGERHTPTCGCEA